MNRRAMFLVSLISLLLLAAGPAHGQDRRDRAGEGSGLTGGSGPGGPGGPGSPGDPGGPGRPPGGAKGPTYEMDSVTSVTGTIQSLSSFGTGEQTVSTMTLKTTGGVILIQLAAPRFMKDQPIQLAAGDEVMVRGSRVRLYGDPVILAAEISIRGETLRLRDPATGRPVPGASLEPANAGPGGGGPIPGGGPPQSDSGSLPPAYSQVRGAWLIPEEDAKSLLRKTQVPLDEFAVLGMARHFSGRTLTELQAMRLELGSWSEVVKKLGGKLEEEVLKSGGGQPSSSHAAGSPPEPSEALAASDERIFRKAHLMTLERLTGRNSKVLLRDLESGRSFESLLPAAPASR